MTVSEFPAASRDYADARAWSRQIADVLNRLMHGKVSPIHHTGDYLFEGVDDPFEATRYHSLIVRKETLPDSLLMTAWTDQDEVMGVRHREHPTFGVQFHPESILTRPGMQILRNFLSIAQQSH